MLNSLSEHKAPRFRGAICAIPENCRKNVSIGCNIEFWRPVLVGLRMLFLAANPPNWHGIRSDPAFCKGCVA